MTRVVAVIAAGLALLALLLILALGRPGAEGPAGDRATELAREPPLLRGRGPASAEQQRPPKVDGPPSSETDDRGGERAGDEQVLVLVEGTLVELRLDGEPVPAAQGELTLSRSTARDETVRVGVENGRWSVGLPLGAEIVIGRVTIGGRLAALDIHARSDFTVEHGMDPLTVQAEVVKSTTVRVVDADTERELSGVRLVRRAGEMDEDLMHPGRIEAEGVICSAADSPITVTVWDREWMQRDAVLWGTCAGCAWGRLVFDQISGGERVLRLKRGGALIVHLGGAAATKDMTLRLREDQPDADEIAPWAEVRVAGDEPLRVDRLPPGDYVASVEIGPWWRSPFPVATGGIEIAAGRVAELTLEIRAVERPKRVPIRGTLVIPAAWDLDDPVLEVTLEECGLAKERQMEWLSVAGGLEVKPERPGTWSFDLGQRPPCVAAFTVRPTGYRQIVTIGEKGDTDVRIVVPPPSRVSVRILDEHTGGDAEVEAIHWHYVVLGDRWGGTIAMVSRDKRTGRFEFSAPVGTIEIHDDVVSAREYDGRIEVAEPSTTRTLTVRPAGSLLLVLLDGTARLPHHTHAEMWRKGEDHAFCWSDDNEGCIVYVRGEGTFRLHLPLIEGFEPVPDRDVSIQIGEQTRVTVDLVRKR